MSTYHRGTRDLSGLPPSALAARLAHALSERKRAREQTGPDSIPLQAMPAGDTGAASVPLSDPPVSRVPPASAGAAVGGASVAHEQAPIVETAGRRVAHTPGREAPAGALEPALRAQYLASFRRETKSESAGPALPLLRERRHDERNRVRGDASLLEAPAQQAQATTHAMRRRGDREALEASVTAMGDMVKQIIPIVDDLERALNHLPEVLWGDPWVAGVLMIGDRLQAMLSRQAVERIVPEGEPFDPHVHEAVSRVHTYDVPEDTITSVLLPGYILNGRVLRPAQVQVAVRKDT